MSGSGRKLTVTLLASTQKGVSLTTAQIEALLTLSTYNVLVGYEAVSMLTKRTMAILERSGYVEVRGVRRPYWTLTKQGQEFVDRFEKSTTS